MPAVFCSVVIFTALGATVDVILSLSMHSDRRIIHITRTSNGRRNIIMVTRRINIIRFNRIYNLCLWSNFRDNIISTASYSGITSVSSSIASAAISVSLIAASASGWCPTERCQAPVQRKRGKDRWPSSKTLQRVQTSFHRFHCSSSCIEFLYNVCLMVTASAPEPPPVQILLQLLIISKHKS